MALAAGTVAEEANSEPVIAAAAAKVLKLSVNEADREDSERTYTSMIVQQNQVKLGLVKRQRGGVGILSANVQFFEISH